MSMRQLKISKSITNRESESLDLYLREIGRIELLTPEQEMALFPRIRRGDQAALDLLTRSNLRFVVSVAKQYQNQGLSLSDLINEGNIGLIHAARKFDETKGFKFISYAVWWIRQMILQALAYDSQLIRIPYNKRLLNNQINKVNSQLEQTLERPATAEELAEVLNMDADEISARMTSAKPVSLDTPLSDGEESSLLDVLENKNEVHGYEKESFNGSLKTEMDRVLQILNNRQREVLGCYFGLDTPYPMSLDEIATRFDLTRERVRQIKDKALGLLRKKETFHLLRGFLGA